MLFDLRSRGRRRTVQVIYLGLALLMMGGLVLFGVGAGNGLGGLLNAFTNNGSGSSNNSQVTQQVKTALKAVNQNPSNSAAWVQLIQARWSAAGQAGDFNSATSTYTAAGKRQLTLLSQDWQRYLTLVKTPDVDVAFLAAEADGFIGQYKGEASAWQDVVLAQPTSVKGYECWAASAYAAKETRAANLAAAKAISLAPKLQQLTLKQLLSEAKTNPQVAQSC